MKFPIILSKQSDTNGKVVYEYTNFDKMPNGYIIISKDLETVSDNNIPNMENSIDFGQEVADQLLPLALSKELPTFFTLLVDQPFSSAFICITNIGENFQIFEYALETPKMGRIELSLNENHLVESIIHLEMYDQGVAKKVADFLLTNSTHPLEDMISINITFEELQERRFKEIPHQDLSLADIPTPYDNWINIADFATTFFPEGDIHKFIDNRNRLRDAFRKEIDLSSFSFDDLRTFLSVEERGSNHRGDSPSGETMVLVYQVVNAIRDKVAFGHKV
ncbi:hypothetical protein BRE01_62830 [Brevibacillus reuszeri]|uniref:Uncharacterized protein n=1 Tax=Brevibacillus reuszeri TaxID=54915 RepID=A0A0K9YW55_9BACL|nr:hypothetical protein [Brevibacillus reuszeri]KNB72964.1 hypothetical protein ADS79_14175 [Brevibacillus reuszeri]GED72581.1 hypothetical protein BRE01_62830 [Brevibacillus reuszeri]